MPQSPPLRYIFSTALVVMTGETDDATLPAAGSVATTEGDSNTGGAANCSCSLFNSRFMS
jgi:hypothetical protein